MSLSDIKTAITDLGGKGQGDLIKFGEWNVLMTKIGETIDEIITLKGTVDDIATYTGFEPGAGISLSDRISALEGHVGDAADTSDDTTLTGRVIKLEEFDIETVIEPFRDQYIISLETSKSGYNLGERAELTATVRTLDGDIPPGNPWVDFITTWGKFKIFSGFTSRLGIDGHSISVQTNDQGIAKVRINAEHTDGFTDAEETQMEDFFGSSVEGTGKTVKEELDGAATPADDKAIGVFKEMKKVYQRNSMRAMHKYTDSYYVGRRSGGVWHGGGYQSGSWNYYRSSVVAVAKEDGDPTTADTKSAASSIQVEFKDWVSSWVGWYFDDDITEVAVWEDLLGPRVNPDIYLTLERFRFTLDDVLDGIDGLIHQEKILKSFDKAIDQIDIPVDPEVSQRTKQVMKYGTNTQRIINVQQYAGQGAVMDGAKHQGFDVILEQAKQLSNIDNMGTEVVELKGSVGRLQESSSTLSDQVLGSMSNVETKLVEYNIPDRAVIQSSIDLIKNNLIDIKNRL